MTTPTPTPVTFFFGFTLDYRSVEASNLDEAITLMLAMRPASRWDRPVVEIPCPARGQIALDTVIASGGRLTRRRGSLVSLRDYSGAKVTINLDSGDWWATGLSVPQIRAALTERSEEITACFARLCPGRRVFAHLGKYRVRLPPLNGADDSSIDHLEGETVFDGRQEQ